MKKIIIGFLTIGVLIVSANTPHDKLRWACSDKVAHINSSLSKAKELSNPKKIDKLRDLLNTTYQVSGECKSTDSNQDFDLDGNELFGTDNLKIVIKKLINGDSKSLEKPKVTYPSITKEAKYLYFDENIGKVFFLIDGVKTGLWATPTEELINNKNRTIKIKYDPESKYLYDVYFPKITKSNNIEKYVNSKFGFSLKYPSDLLTQKTYPENGDGVWLKNKYGTVTLTPSGSYAIDTHSIRQAYKETIKWKNEDRNIEITYKVQKKNWFVLSGYNHKNKTIFYDKRYFVYSSEEDSNIIIGFDIEFPIKDKKKYDSLIKTVSKSFHQ